MLTMLKVHPSLSSGQAEPSVTEDESSKLGTAESVSAADVRRTRPGRPSNPPPRGGKGPPYAPRARFRATCAARTAGSVSPPLQNV